MNNIQIVKLKMLFFKKIKIFFLRKKEKKQPTNQKKKPQNQKLWKVTYFAWLNRWQKKIRKLESSGEQMSISLAVWTL